MATKSTSEDTVKDNTSNGLKLIGEVIVPGASQFVDGHVKSGTLHLLGSVAAMACLGPSGLLVSALIRGNSFTTSTLNKPILKALFEKKNAAAPAATT